MLRNVRAPILPRRAILTGLGGAGLAALLAACGGSKSTPTVDGAFATNAARNVSPTNVAASVTGSGTSGTTPVAGSATTGTPAATGSKPASTVASGSSVAAGGGAVGTTAAVTATVATSGGGHIDRWERANCRRDRPGADPHHRRRAAPEAAADAGRRAADRRRRPDARRDRRREQPGASVR